MARRVLVADTPEGERRLSDILAGHDLRFVHTLGEAQRELGLAAFDLIIVGARFDDSRMFDLLRYFQSSARHGNRPVVCVRSQHFVSPAISIEGLEIAARTLGCMLFVDLTRYADDAQGNASVRRLLDGLLAP